MNTDGARDIKNCYLVGFMGSGKSVTAKLVSDRLGLPAAELDSIIESEEGMTAGEIFALYGEAYFRNAEKRVLLNAAEGPRSVVSCGGGVVLDPDNIRIMKSTGVIIRLRASAAETLRRLEGDTGRPLLAGKKTPEALEDMMSAREDFYRTAADHTIDTDLKTVEDVSEEVIRIYEDCYRTGFPQI